MRWQRLAGFQDDIGVQFRNFPVDAHAGRVYCAARCRGDLGPDSIARNQGNFMRHRFIVIGSAVFQRYRHDRRSPARIRHWPNSLRRARPVLLGSLTGSISMDADRWEQRNRERIERRQERWARRGNACGGPNAAAGMIIGLGVIAVGGLFLLRNVGIVYFDDIWQYWPVILIVVGVSKLANPYSASNVVRGLIICGVC